ncbi:MAG: hypothetical protein ABGX31_06790, partial [bacterium]
GKASTSTKLIVLAEDKQVDLFHTPDGKGYATVPVKKHKQTWPISCKGFKDWLRGEFYKKYRKPPNSQALTDALGVLDANAQFEGEKHQVFTRIAWKDGNVYIDLAGPSGRVVKVTPSGWNVLDVSEVRFTKGKNLAEIPEPQLGGVIEELSGFVNIQGEVVDSWRRLFAGLVAAFLKGPFTILAIVGESGSAKTTTTRVLTLLIDPSEADLRSLPRSERDLMITAVNGWVLAFDNVSGVPIWVSDAFCRLATGSGFTTRELYTNSEEAIFKAKRPLILNGIDDMANRGDLLSRTILLSLFPIKETIDEGKFWTRFEETRPKIFGSILEILSKVLYILPTLEVSGLPRMADFARVGVAVEKALIWPEGTFLDAYKTNRNKSSALPLESLFAVSLIDFITKTKEWEGTATELLSEINEVVEKERRINLKEWPKTPQVLGSELRRLAPNLRTTGIYIQWGDGSKRRTFKITREDKHGKSLSQPSPSSPFHKKSINGDNDDNGDSLSPILSSGRRFLKL